MAEFKLPQNIPQDLLLIQELIGIPEPPATIKVGKEEAPPSDNDDIASSGSEDEDGNASEDEIAADLVAFGDDSEPNSAKSGSEPSDSETSSDSDSEPPNKGDNEAMEDDDEDEPAPGGNTGVALHTKNEVLEAHITIPDVDEVGADEQLEKVGDVINIVDQIAIVQGIASKQPNRGAQTALDSETLLVFDDRKVMGYVYETFGPTTQPLYQVKFNSQYPLNPDRVKIDRTVFSVPSRSKFVFVDRLKTFKGSDASNVYDEEPADDELEFSDDEAESAFRSCLKRKRAETRSRSQAPSRRATPNPSHMRDQQLADIPYGHNAYSEHGPYDIGFSEPGPSRPRPSAYDDPYANPYETDMDETSATQQTQPQQPRGRPNEDMRVDHRPNTRGRGRGRGRGQPTRGRGALNRPEQGRADPYENNPQQQPWLNTQQNVPYPYSEPYDPRAAFPTATQSFGGNMHLQQGGYQGNYDPDMLQGGFANPHWGYAQQNNPMEQIFAFDPAVFQQQQGATGMMPFVQPHINPRFAPNFGFSYPQQQQPRANDQQYSPHNQNDNSQEWPAR